MDDIVSLILIVGILGVVALFAFYLVKTYVLPKQIGELAELIANGQAAIAIRKLQTLVEEDDHNSYLHFLLGEAHSALENTQEAIMEYKAALKYLGQDPRAKEEIIRNRLAKKHLETRNFNEAKKEYLILTKISPDDPENFYQVGILFENAGISEKALPYFIQAVKIKPTHEDAQFHIGVINYNHKNIRDAREALTEAIKANPKHHGAHYYLGQCLRSAKDLDWSIKEFDTAAKDESWKGRALLGKALCLYEKGAFPQAVAELQTALNFSGGSSELKLNIYYSMAAAAEKMRDFTMAIANWEKIMDINPRFRDVSDKLAKYEEFRVHDSIKDFMIASPGKFERICRDMVEGEGYHVSDLSVVSDGEVNLIASDAAEGTGWRSSKRPTTLFIIYRTTEPIQEKDIRALHENIRQKGITRAVCMTTSEFTAQAEIFCQSRPIELVERKGIINKLRQFV
ncbi:MAG: tetratricopeptide repeat protein [Leptospirales bacterium]